MRPTVPIKGSIPAIVRNDMGLYLGDLRHYFRALFLHAGNLDNPYHNFRHVTHVLWLCMEACKFYSHELTAREMRNVLIAALFHDFDHSGQPIPDSENIRRAIAGLQRHIASEDMEHFRSITYLIEITEFPYKIETQYLGLQAQIIRDADMSQAMSVAWIQQVVFGLAKEWGKKSIDVLRMQRPFHQNLKFHTRWAQELFPPEVIREKISESEELIELLEEPDAALV